MVTIIDNPERRIIPLRIGAIGNVASLIHEGSIVQIQSAAEQKEVNPALWKVVCLIFSEYQLRYTIQIGIESVILWMELMIIGQRHEVEEIYLYVMLALGLITRTNP